MLYLQKPFCLPLSESAVDILSDGELILCELVKSNRGKKRNLKSDSSKSKRPCLNNVKTPVEKNEPSSSSSSESEEDDEKTKTSPKNKAPVNKSRNAVAKSSSSSSSSESESEEEDKVAKVAKKRDVSSEPSSSESTESDEEETRAKPKHDNAKSKFEDSREEIEELKKKMLMELENSQKQVVQTTAKVSEQKDREESSSESSDEEDAEAAKKSQVEASTPSSSQGKRKRKRKRRPRNRNKLPKTDGDTRPLVDKTAASSGPSKIPVNPKHFVPVVDYASTTSNSSQPSTLTTLKPLQPSQSLKPSQPSEPSKPSQNGDAVAATPKLGKRSRDVSCEEALLGPSLGVTNGARKSSNPSLSKPVLRAASSGYLSPNLKPTSPARSLNFDKLLGLAQRGKPIVGTRSDTAGSQGLGNPSNVETGNDVPAPNYDALPALCEIPSVGSEIAFKVSLG